jgi:hypothetical protein
MLPLPCLTTVRSAMEKIQRQPGIHKSNLKIIKTKLNLTKPTDKLCFILIDEMSIRQNIAFDSKNGSFIGFEDDGNIRTTKQATLSLCIMAVGIVRKWKVPFGYILVNKSAPYNKIIKMIEDAISALEEEDFEVLGITSDQGSNLERAFRILGSTPENPEIIINEKNYFVYKDPPHLLKNTRNYLYQKAVQMPLYSSPAEWSHLVSLFNDECGRPYKFVPKLSRKHLYDLRFQNKMKVKLASQVLSNSCASSLEYLVSCNKMHPSVLATSVFCKKFNDLFDIMNSSNLKCAVPLRRALQSSSEAHNLLKKFPSFIEELKNLNMSRSKVKFMDGWIQSIKVVLKLLPYMNSLGLPYLCTRNLCQDPLENFFGRIRFKQKVPDTKQFITFYANIASSSLLRAPKTTNCEDDDVDEKVLNVSTTLLNQVLSYFK